MVSEFHNPINGWFKIAGAISVVLAVIVTTIFLPACVAVPIFNASNASLNEGSVPLALAAEPATLTLAFAVSTKMPAVNTSARKKVNVVFNSIFFKVIDLFIRGFS